MKVTMIRHTSVDVPKGTCYGQTDVPLKDTFPIDSMVISRELAKYSFDAAYTSPLTRCRRLAEACGYPDACVDDRLMEINFGEWEMQLFDEIQDPQFELWKSDVVNVAATGGESFLDQNRRLQSFLDDLKKTGVEHVAVFTHGGIIMQAMLLAGLVTLDELYENQPPFGGILTIEI